MSDENVHAIYVNVGGRGKHPVVTMWCSDCIVVVAEFDQINEWASLERAAAVHRSQPSRREVLRVTQPVPADADACVEQTCSCSCHGLLGGSHLVPCCDRSGQPDAATYPPGSSRPDGDR